MVLISKVVAHVVNPLFLLSQLSFHWGQTINDPKCVLYDSLCQAYVKLLHNEITACFQLHEA